MIGGERPLLLKVLGQTDRLGVETSIFNCFPYRKSYLRLYVYVKLNVTDRGC